MNEGSQTNQLATCDIFSVAMMSFTPTDGATFEHL